MQLLAKRAMLLACEERSIFITGGAGVGKSSTLNKIVEHLRAIKGDDTVFVTACSQPNNFAAVGGDCDDTAASNSPGAPEVCDGADNDCNSLADYVTTADDGGGESDSDGDGTLDCADCSDQDSNENTRVL